MKTLTIDKKSLESVEEEVQWDVRNDWVEINSYRIPWDIIRKTKRSISNLVRNRIEELLDFPLF